MERVTFRRIGGPVLISKRVEGHSTGETAPPDDITREKTRNMNGAEIYYAAKAARQIEALAEEYVAKALAGLKAAPATEVAKTPTLSGDTPRARPRVSAAEALAEIERDGEREQAADPSLTKAQGIAKALESSPSARRNWATYTGAHRSGEPGIPGAAPVTKASTVSTAVRDEASAIAKAIMGKKDPREREVPIAKLYEILP